MAFLFIWQFLISGPLELASALIAMGVAPEFLPGLASFEDQAMRDKLAKAWDVTLPATGSGADLMEILKRCRGGQIRALYVVGENPLATLPASLEVRAALDRLELLVVQDPFLTETGQMAHDGCQRHRALRMGIGPLSVQCESRCARAMDRQSRRALHHVAE